VNAGRFERAQIARLTTPLEWTLLGVLAVVFIWRGFIPAWGWLNTDFPNYYIAGRLFRDGYPLDRLYEWSWIQRQKDHLGIDQALVGYVPLSLFSGLIVAPLTSLSPLAAKRVWLVVNLLLLLATGLLLRRMTRLAPRRIALMVLLAVVPLRTNFQFGQQHVLVLLLVTVAAWLYSTRRSAASGLTLAVAAAIKIYPALFLFYFLRKRDWRAVAALLFASVAIAAIGVELFGLEALRVYVVRVLPRSLPGESNDPYTVVFNSPTALLRRLFIAEPELNPHPLTHAPMVFIVLQPLIQALIFVPGLWLLAPRRADAQRENLDWAAFVALLLMFSSGSATYHFCVLILSAALGVDYALNRGWWRAGVGLAGLFGAVCFPFYRFVPPSPSGWRIFLGFPRLYALTAFWTLFVWVLWRASTVESAARRRFPRPTVGFSVALAAMVAAGIVSNLRHLNHQFDNYSARADRKTVTLVATAPSIGRDAIYFARMDQDGSTLDRTGDGMRLGEPRRADLFHPTVSAVDGTGWVELASTTSKVVRFPVAGVPPPVGDWAVEIEGAEDPVVSSDARWLGFLREDHGRNRLFLLDRRQPTSGRSPVDRGREVTAAPSDVLDFGFFPDGRIVLSANRDRRSRLFSGDERAARFIEIDTSERPARFPAISPDGERLAYSREERGQWQLWVLQLASGRQNRLTTGDCNSIMPAWARDSTTIVYASDCGRGLGQTALCTIRSVP
jgi:hypothetical protein